MLMPDVNVLVYAHRTDEACHLPYRLWVERMVEGPQPFALSALVAVGFLRIVTNARIYRSPTPLPLALATLDMLVSRPTCLVLGPGSSHLHLVGALCRASGAAGKAVADAQHAAVAVEHGCTFVTRDRDFAAFAPFGLNWQHLLLDA